MLKTKGWIAGLFGMSLLLAACNGGDGATAVSEADLVAKWYFKRSVAKGFIRTVDASGKELFRFNVDEDTTYAGNTHYIEFVANHTYTANYPEDAGDIPLKRAARPIETGTWSVSGNTVTTISSEGDTSKVAAAISGSNATFTLDMSVSESDPETGGRFETDIEATLHAAK